MNNISRQRIGFVLRKPRTSGTGNDRGGINGEIGKAKMGRGGRDREGGRVAAVSLFRVSKRALNGPPGEKDPGHRILAKLFHRDNVRNARCRAFDTVE